MVLTLLVPTKLFAEDAERSTPRFLHEIYCTNLEGACPKRLTTNRVIQHSADANLIMGPQNISGYYLNCDFLQFWEIQKKHFRYGGSEEYRVLVSCSVGEGDPFDYTDILSLSFEKENASVEVRSMIAGISQIYTESEYLPAFINPTFFHNANTADN